MRKILLIILLVLCNECTKAQELFSAEDERSFYGSFNLGASFSQIDGDNFFGYHKVGFTGGGAVYVRFQRVLAVSLGLGYVQKGCREESVTETPAGQAVYSYKVHLQYAEVPLLFHLFGNFTENRVFRQIHLSGGLSYARLISSTETVVNVNPVMINPEEHPFQKHDWSMILGLTYRLHGPWFLGGQFQYTLGSIRSDPYILPGYGQGTQQNNVLTFRVQYMIGSGNAGY